MKKSFILLLFLAIPAIAQQKVQNERYQIHFQPNTDAGKTVTLLLDTQTGKTWLLIHFDDVSAVYKTSPDVQKISFYCWQPMFFQPEPISVGSGFQILPSDSKR
jgi:hypothetical protein